MNWTDRPDGEACCPGLLGAVTEQESVARLLITRDPPPQGYEPIRRSELFPSPEGFSNECGDADGLSVDRCNGLSDDDLRTRSEAHACQQTGRRGNGAIIAGVADLRATILEGVNSDQAVFVYDDARSNNQEHSVVRCVEVSRPRQTSLRDHVASRFSRTVNAV
jgi:hypothetical protein